MERQPIVAVEGLRIDFGKEQEALAGLSFSIDSGKTLAIIGENGSGKTLAGLALMGQLPDTATWSGEIRINDIQVKADMHVACGKDASGATVSMIFQESASALNPVIKVGSQLAEALRASTSLTGAESRHSAIEWLDRVGIPAPEKSYHKYPHQLSSSQKQRIMIAMAMGANPALLIADEPASALDVIEQAEIIKLLKELQVENGMALLFITHHPWLAQLADDILVLRQGQTIEHGPAEQVLHNPQHSYTKAFLAIRPRGLEKGKHLPTIEDFIESKADTEWTIAASPSSNGAKKPESNEPLLQVRHLRVWFPTETDWLGTPLHFLRAVEDVSFDLHRGEALGLIGESGCGKSTISRAIIGLQNVESGQMSFEGRDLIHLDAQGWRRMRREVQIINRTPFSSLDPRCTVGVAVMEPLQAHRIVPRREARNEAERVTELVGLSAADLQRYPHQLSEGQLHRIGIARALALRPKLLICDESISALDANMRVQILNLLKDLQAALKLSYLFISHDLNAVRYIADRVIVMQAGKIVERGNAEQVLEHPQQEYTRKLVAAMP